MTAEPFCQALIRTAIGLLRCGAPAVRLDRYACIHEHVKDRWTCTIHEPKPGLVGCQDCLQLGHECDLVHLPAPIATRGRS